MNKLKKSMLAGIFLLFFLLLVNFHLKLFIPFSAVFWVSRIYFWIVLAAIVFYARKVEKQNFLLYEEQKYHFSKALLMAILVVIVMIFGMAFLNSILIFFGLSQEPSQETKTVYSLFEGNYLLLIFTCITAGVTEEFLFRGYLQTRLERLFNKTWAGILISALVFGIMHISWNNFFHIVGSFWIGLVLAYFYYKYRNIKILIFLHIFYDLFSIVAKLLLDIFKA